MYLVGLVQHDSLANPANPRYEEKSAHLHNCLFRRAFRGRDRSKSAQRRAKFRNRSDRQRRSANRHRPDNRATRLGNRAGDLARAGKRAARNCAAIGANRFSRWRR